MKEKGKKIITLSIILFMVLNYLLPLVNYAEFNLDSVKDVIVKGVDETQEEIGREYEIKETEEWDISKNGDRSVIAKWKLEDRSLTISGTGEMKNWDDKSDVNWHKKYKKMITKVIIEDGITNIGEYAFYECRNITSITMPNSITSIETSVFEGCNSLKNITIPNSVISIGGKAFKGCSSLENITISNSVTSIEDYAFEGCSSLENIIIPNSVTNIGDHAFEGCSSLTEINVLDNNTKYTSIDGVLYNKEKTEIIRYPSNKKDKEYNISNRVINIRKSAFYKCSNLTCIIIPNSVISIGNSAFEGCSSLTSVNIPDSVTSIGWHVFERCSSLTSVNLPNSVTSIEGYAFYECSNLTSIAIPNSVKNIGDYAFYECNNLTSIIILNNVTSIGRSTFSGVKNIICKTNSYAHKYAEENNIFYILSDSVKSNYTTEYQIKETEEWDISKKEDKSIIAKWKLNDRSLTVSGTGKMKDWDENSKSEWYKKYKKLVEKVIIENGITNIGNYVFIGCSRLRSITIPNSVTSIGNSAFKECSSLTYITIPESVTHIEYMAFYKCTSIISITIPNGVTSIGWYTFKGCSSLTSITIPSSVTSIGNQTLEECNNLAEINVSDNNTKYTSIDGVLFNKEKTELIKYPPNKNDKEYSIPNSVISIESRAFEGCSGLTSVNIPESVISIGDSAFNGCSSLTEINVLDNNTQYTGIGGVLYNRKMTQIIKYPSNKKDKEYNIPNSVTEIRYSAFKGCSSLTFITIPKSVTSIGDSAFNGCNNLLSIVVPESVKVIKTKALDNVNTIICQTNSYVHKYAEENKIPYLLDEEEPIIELKYSIKDRTNQNVIATITANEEVQEVTGWTLSQDKKTLTKVYESNTTETVSIKDIIGNETKLTINISNIYKTLKGDVNENNKIDIGDILLLKRHLAYTNSTSIANKHLNWKLSDEKIQIGDLNNNGKIDIGDILKLQRYISASNSKEVAEKHKDWLNLE